MHYYLVVMKLGQWMGGSLAKQISTCRLVFYWILLKKAGQNDGKNMANENSALRWGCDTQMSQTMNKKGTVTRKPDAMPL